MKELTKEELNSLLKRFYAGARKENGEVYKMTAFNALRYGLQQHFLELKSWDIKTDSSFMECNQIFRTMQVRLKQCGKGKIKSYPEIEPDDIRQLYSSFDVETPRGLQEKVWFNIMFRLCRRGRENLRQMTISSFAVAVDATGAKFVFQVEDECDKNHNENDASSYSPSEGSMYAVEGHSLCPVKMFELYDSKLNPNCPFLWTKPKENVTNADECWYSKSPLGEKTLGWLQRARNTILVNGTQTTASELPAFKRWMMRSSRADTL